MLPTTKNDPGARLLEDKVTTPELSVAVGSTQDTVIPPTLRPIWLVTSSIQATTGATSSTEIQTKVYQKCFLNSLQKHPHKTSFEIAIIVRHDIICIVLV